jgi:hypothetical protein
MTVARCLYISCVHDSTMLLDLFDALTTSQHVLSACVRSFTEIDNDNDKNVISMQYATPWPWHVLIPWSPDHVISPPSHLVILVFHIPINIPMQVPCQSLGPIAWNPHVYPSLPCGFRPIIPSIISLLFYTSSLPWFYSLKLWRKAQKYLENIPVSNWSKSTKNLTQYPFEIFLWIQWSKLNTNPLDQIFFLQFKSLPWILKISLV